MAIDKHGNYHPGYSTAFNRIRSPKPHWKIFQEPRARAALESSRGWSAERFGGFWYIFFILVFASQPEAALSAAGRRFGTCRRLPKRPRHRVRSRANPVGVRRQSLGERRRLIDRFTVPGHRLLSVLCLCSAYRREASFTRFASLPSPAQTALCSCTLSNKRPPRRVQGSTVIEVRRRVDEGREQ